MPTAHDGDSIYSPGTSEQGQIALARSQFENQVVVPFVKKMEEQQKAMDQGMRKLEAERERVREQEAANWRETTVIRTRQNQVELELGVVKRDKEILAKRSQQLQKEADLRRRNRTLSEAYIEDSFALLSPRAVVENLTNASEKMRKHAMNNISTCIGGNKDPSPTFVQFTPQDIAPDLLPKLHQLVSSSTKPVDSVVQFAEETVSAPPMTRALALGGQCSRLGDYLVEVNELTSRLAVCCLRQMVRMETSVVQPAYEAMALAIPQIPIPEPYEQTIHPSIDFVKEVAPKIIEDCFNNGLWLAVAPLVSHQITSIRQIVLQKVVLLARNARNLDGIVEAHLLGLLDSYYQSSSPPPDVITFFVDLLPLVAEKLFCRPAEIRWLLNRLGDQNAKITDAVIKVFHACVTKGDPMVFQTFVTADVLRKLNDSPIPSPEVMKLISELLLALAIPHVRAKAVDGIVRFLDHRDPNVVTACLSACKKIVESTLEDRTHLFTEVSKLSVTKKSTLEVYDFAMPAFCRDWAASGDFNMISQYIQHSELQLRHPAQSVWRDIVRNSPTSRSKIVHDHLLDVIFELCSSYYPDAVTLGADCCPPMAIEITKAGVPPTEKLVGLLGHKTEFLRQAALRGIQLATENSDVNCQVLLKAGIFKALHLYFEEYPKDPPESAKRILVRLVPFLRTSREACSGLLQLLVSKSSNVRFAAREALLAISSTNIGNREILRAVILDRLEFPNESLVEYAVKAIQDWIGPDLAHLNDFPKFFSLIEHADKHIQTAAMISLKQKLSNTDYQESLEKANIISLLRSLSNSDNSEALNFVAVALRVLALSLARNGHAGVVIELAAHKQPRVRDGAATALETVCSGSVQDRKCVVEKNIIQNLVNRVEHLDQTQSQLLASIIPMLVFDYLEAGKIDLIFTLVDHSQEQIRTAASKSVVILANGTMEQKTCLRAALLPRLEQASSSLREVTANCLSRSLAHDLVTGGDFTQIFRILRSEDFRVRETIIARLRTYIQVSDETARGRLVDARILPEILQVYTPAKDDLLDFMSSCLLPMLGPSFTQDDGGATLFPLLEHQEPRLRVSAIQALKNAIDSRYGNMENMAKAYIVGTLHPFTESDDVIRDLWCRILPKAAPYLANRAEIDILFDSLKSDRGNVREAASEAISVLAKTSDTSRSNMLPTLLHNLENPTPASIPSIAQAISLSGSTFVSNGKEAELLYLIQDDKDVGVAAVEAIVQLLAKGSSFEHEQLVKAQPDILTVALRLHNRQSQRQQSIKLLRSIVVHLSYILFLDEELAREMFLLFDDPDPVLSNMLYQTWSSDSRVFESNILPELIPLLFDDERLRNPSVTALLRELARTVVPKLVTRRRLDILIGALKINDANVVQSYLEETRYVIEDCNENEKGWFVAQPSFVPAVGKYLKGRDAAMRRDCSSIIQLLSMGSASRSGRIMNEGIGKYLSWVAVKGEKGAQESSLEALCALFMAAPDHAERLVTDSLPALCNILEKEDLALGVHIKALYLLSNIVQQSPHSPIIDSGIVAYIVRWLSPRYTVTDAECKKCVLDICRLIAEHSDAGRKALIGAGILPELVQLASSQTGYEVIGACKILKALVHTGTFRQHIIAAGLKTSMEHITSLIRKSTLKVKEEKSFAQAMAKEVLEILKLSKRRDVESLLQTQVPQGLLGQTNPPAMTFAPQRNTLAKKRQPRDWRRSISESLIFNTPVLDLETEEVRGNATRNTRHPRTMSDPAQPATRPRRADMEEGLDISDPPQDTPIIEEEDLEYVEPSPLSGGRRTPHSSSSYPQGSRRQRTLDDDHLTDASFSPVPTDSPASPQSYRPSAPMRLGSARRRMDRDDHARELPSDTFESEFGSYAGERGTTAASSQGTTQRSYWPTSGSVRRR